MPTVNCIVHLKIAKRVDLMVSVFITNNDDDEGRRKLLEVMDEFRA